MPDTIDDYLRAFPPDIRALLQQIREVIHREVPQAQETISYRMPAFRTTEVLVYFAAFKRHIGLYPPVRGDAALEREVAPYAGPKGNLQFPLDQPVPFELIGRIAAHRLRQAQAAQAARAARAALKRRPPAP